MKEKPFKLLVDYVYTPGGQGAFTFAQDRVAIGRAHSNDVMLTNTLRLVSRRHAEIRRQAGVFWLVDLGSKNATWLNGRRLEAERPYTLHHGDRFRVGDFQIEFVEARAQELS
jgi:pSer/pThr/pTyr-binding forkhead associated (FHA) protein